MLFQHASALIMEVKAYVNEGASSRESSNEHREINDPPQLAMIGKAVSSSFLRASS